MVKEKAIQTYRLLHGGKTLVVHNPLVGPMKLPIGVFADIVGVVLCRFVGITHSPHFPDIKEVASKVLLECSSQLIFNLYSPTPHFPRRQIIITNHTHTPFRDAFSFFPLIPSRSKIVVVQHNFNKVIALVSKKAWGGWTIDKDDKTPAGKAKLNQELQKIVEHMKTETDLTVVIYPQGRVPKNPEDCRAVGTMYPGAFYMSLMTQYPITPLINDLSDKGVFTLSVKPPIDLYGEYHDRIRESPHVGEFRSDPTNKKVLDEICERFRSIYQTEYDMITKTEHGRTSC
jgi:1-acyl-sn-glycerol-3-phosphate acyltransferase